MAILLTLSVAYLLVGVWPAVRLAKAGAPFTWSFAAFVAWPVMAGWVLWLLLCAWRDD